VPDSIALYKRLTGESGDKLRSRMRATILMLLLFPAISAADAYIPMCPATPPTPWSYTLDGVGYSLYGPGLDNYSESLAACFSVPVSYFEFKVTFPTGAISPEIATNIQYTYVLWSEPQFVPPLGVAPSGPIATVIGTVGGGVTALNIGASVGGIAPPGGPLGLVGFSFVSLNDASVMAAVPEPSTLSLIGLGLFAIAIAGRWRNWFRTTG
jgi:hypothetical protein